MVKFIFTVREIQDMGNWTIFCELFGIDEYALAEGTLSENEEYTLTELQKHKVFDNMD